MKLKILFLIVLLFSVSIYSQEQKITVEVSLKEATIRKSAKSVPVNVKITNMSDRIISTSGFEWVTLNFSRCPQTQKCDVRGDVYCALTNVKSAYLKKYEAVEFEVNLADLYWNDLTSSIIDFSQPKNLFTVPFANKYLLADVMISKEDIRIEGVPGKFPAIQSFKSNEIEVSLLF